MSVLLLLLLLLLGFSSHACGGIAVDHHSISKEIDEKLNPEARVSTPPMPTTDEGDDRTVENELDAHELDHGAKASGTSESESVASVRWRVPHRKKGVEPEPVFNLDYLPPRTHPPVHN